jgi:hypothetical protein
VSYKGDDKCGRRSFRVLKQGVQGVESTGWSFSVFISLWVLSDGSAISVRELKHLKHKWVGGKEELVGEGDKRSRKYCVAIRRKFEGYQAGSLCPSNG